MNIGLFSRIVSFWVVCISTFLGFALSSSTQNSFFSLGPNTNVQILGFVIDTYIKYLIVCCYITVNTIIRSINTNIVYAWIVQNVQNDNYIEQTKRVYEITIMYRVYVVVDWLMYVNVLLSQCDFFIVEVLTDIVATYILTYLYLKNKIPIA